MINLVLLSDFSKKNNLQLEERIKSLIAGKSFKLGYIPSKSDKERKYFIAAKEYFRSLDINEFLYFDVDEEYDESLLGELESCDGLYLSGGNTFYFLKNLQKRNLLGKINEMAINGKLLIGVSAGSILMSKTIKIAAFIDENIVHLEPLNALDLIDFEFMPHWDTQNTQLPELLGYSKLKTIYTCNDGDGIVITGEHIEFYGKINEIRNGKIIEGGSHHA
ncbi:Type 1 glutamine amidotransferase-like domain-containing protein [Neobacillus sp. NRS-1170]|uniref:Type 1 glutamine amidotransferase-like domain-containing protein n=1 Tax=Neobacillus sp. NRS-1170 TaxID=3233898 RepID=UPI003D2A7C15